MANRYGVPRKQPGKSVIGRIHTPDARDVLVRKSLCDLLRLCGPGFIRLWAGAGSISHALCSKPAIPAKRIESIARPANLYVRNAI